MRETLMTKGKSVRDLSPHVYAAIERLLEARRGGPAIPPSFVEAHPLTFADAMVVQERVQIAYDAVAAWKVAPASTPEQPNLAPIFKRNVYGASARIPRGRFRKTGIECELAFKLGRDLVTPPYTREQVADAIAGILPLIEICDSRLEDRTVASVAWRLADYMTNGAILTGAVVEDWRSIDTAKQAVKLTFNGEVKADVAGSSGGDLITVVQTLANHPGAHCMGVRAGQIVTTGTMTGCLWTGPGTEIVARYSSLGELKIVLEA
jgi:2-keto-4-pentenoate hydratase